MPTFRGTNYRTDGSYGTAEVLNEDIKKVWSMNVGYLNDPIWIGCGWTGQPLVVQWDEETRQIMNLHEDKKNKEGLTEVIYAKMDGRVHFFDIEDGSETRKPLKLGMVPRPVMGRVSPSTRHCRLAVSAPEVAAG